MTAGVITQPDGMPMALCKQHIPAGWEDYESRPTILACLVCGSEGSKSLVMPAWWGGHIPGYTTLYHVEFK